MRTFYVTKDLSGDEGQEPGFTIKTQWGSYPSFASDNNRTA